jgi:hypothetical protein
MANDKQPSFAERRALMAKIAEDLLKRSDAVHDEAERMAAAEKRFTERRGGKAQRRAR